MRLPLSLLKNYIDIEDLSVDKISDLLTLAGLEVEAIENKTPPFRDVVVGQITSVEPLKNDLNIVKVTDGKKTYQVICKAPNCKKNMKTAFAKVGAFIKTKEVKPLKIQGIESSGVLLSRKELGIGVDSSGIMDIKDLKLGEDLSSLSSPVLEISLTPNLGHCMSVIGIARELAALTNKKVKYPETVTKTSGDKKIKIKVSDTQNCMRYSALIIENVKIEPSPSCISNYLEASGIRSINNIVDIMNFVMLESGQPLHAFDLDKLENEEIEISSLKKEENFLGLDHVNRKIPKNTLVIRDSKKTIAIAGIIGGENSAVNENTKNILIESACFSPLSIRKSSRNLNLRTESSLRFEKASDFNATLSALKRTSYLIQNLNKKVIISKNIEDIFSKEKKPLTIPLRTIRANKILGTKLSINEMDSIFQKLEFKISQKTDDIIEVSPPTYRNDLKKEIDLIEEIARIYGYNNIEKKPPFFTSSTLPSAPLYLFEKKLKKIFTSLGMQEFLSCDLISEELSKTIKEESPLIKVMHAKSKEQSILRSSFLPSFLQIAKYNLDRKNFNFSAFEIGKIHFKKKNEFLELPTSALIMCGLSRPYHFNPKPKNFDFLDLKGILENLLTSLKIKNYKFQRSNHPSFHPGRQANLLIENANIGVIGEVHPSILSPFDIKKTILFAELNNALLLDYQKEDTKFVDIPHFPSSDRDLTITLSKKTEISKILDQIKSLKSPILEKVFLTDIYYDKKSEKKNITFRFIYRDKTKTVSFDEVETEHKKIIKKIKEFS
jgi:phenylalanyl-tRNA synthetase beta chain